MQTNRVYIQKRATYMAPVYIFSKRSILLSIGGCVASRLPLPRDLRFFPNGLEIYIEAVAGLAFFISSVLELIFLSALDSPTGLRVNSTADASAKYSRFLDIANRVN